VSEVITGSGEHEDSSDSTPLHVLSRLADDLQALNRTGFSVSLGRLLPKLGNHLETARRVVDLGAVSEADVRAWVDAPLQDGHLPSVATRRNRRAAARLAFRLLREQGVVGHDPTVDLTLPLRTRDKGTRPLTDVEIGVGRAAALFSLEDTSRGASWALAEATATTHEIPLVARQHVDLANGLVWLSGSSKVDARLASLTDWGVHALRRRINAIEGDGLPVASTSTATTPASLQARAAAQLSRTLREAGLASDPAVRPASIRAWAGRRVFLATGQIDKAALALGTRTLDNAAAVIGFAWRHHP